MQEGIRKQESESSNPNTITLILMLISRTSSPNKGTELLTKL